MGVLAAIFAHTRDVPLDVTWVQGRLVERRIEELDQLGVAADQTAIDALHGNPRSFARPCAGKDRPALRQGVDLALRVASRSERRAVVEISAAIPFSVPAVLFDVAPEPAS